jgi:hypothetical protein
MAEQDAVREAAIERIKNRRGFVPHVIAYTIINALLVAAWAAGGGGYFWPIWIMGGWGVGLVLHAWTAFAEKPITEEDVEREIERGGPAAA